MPRRRVALLIESSRSYGRGLLHGLAEYARIHDGWTVTLDDRNLGDQLPAWLRTWRSDGVIARLESRKMLEAVLALRVPAVDLRGLYREPRIPFVETDESGVVRLAFEHLLERGLQRFAFCGFEGTNYSDTRRRLFLERAAEEGVECHVYRPPAIRHRGTTVQIETAHIRFESHLAAWLASLPRPIGLMACNDIRGHQVLQACRLKGLSVPDEVAVVGVDNDELLCELCAPALSSVVPDTRRIALEAGSLLDRMMSRPVRSPQSIFIPPVKVIGRESSDILVNANSSVVTAVRYIREHACDGIDVSHVLAQVGCSRSTLERSFLESLGRTPKAEINRVRLERIKQLLTETAFPLARIAEMTGFEHPEYLNVFFRREARQSPGVYRAANRGAERNR